MKLKGRVAIVTGGANGIGSGISKVLGADGALVVVADKDATRGPQIVAELKLTGDALFVETDVSDSQSVQNLMATVKGETGHIDVLVNDAGRHLSKTIDNTSEAEWDIVQSTNLKSTFLCSKYAIPHLRETRGCIVNIASMVGLVGQSRSVAYSATKGGQIAMTKGMALDHAVDGIRVNVVCPGWVETPLVDRWFAAQDDPDESRKYILSRHPLGRISTPEEIGKAVLFLASGDDSGFITGSVLTVEGAITLGY